jgi:hypothetical protein
MSNQLALVEVARKMGGRVLPDNTQWTNRIEIKSASSNRLYTVAQRKGSGEVGCSCMGWIRHRRCKHSQVFAPALAAAFRAREVR